MKLHPGPMPRLVAVLNAQLAPLLTLWAKSSEEACMSAKLQKAIRANLKGLGIQ